MSDPKIDASKQVEAAVEQQARVNARKSEVEASPAAKELGSKEPLTPEQYFEKYMSKDEDDDVSAEAEDEVDDVEDEDEQDSEEESGDDEVSEETPSTTPKATEQLDHETALSILRRAGVPSKILEGLDDEALLAWAGKQSKRENDIQSAFRERAELKKQLEQGQQVTKSTEQKPTVEADLSEAAKGIFETFDEDVAKALVDFSKLSMKPMADKLQQYEAALEKSNSIIEHLMEKDLRAALRERFPQLEKKGAWEKVKAKASALAQTEAYADAEDPMQAVFSDAARLVFTKDTDSVEAQKSDRSLRQRKNGSPTPPKRSSASKPSDMSQDDVMYEQFKAIERGEGRQGSLKVLEKFRR